MKWKYDPKPLGAAKGVACCDVVNRGAAYADGTLFFNTLDGRTIALDAGTGRPKWITQLGDINKGETMTMAPLVVKGKVLVGNSGGEFGVRGWLTALDAATGAVAWRAYSTGPGQGRADRAELQAVLRERPRQGPRRSPPGRAKAWRTGGGTVWGWISYDPELDLIYYGTGQPGPVESRAAARRQQVDRRRCSRATRHRRGASGSTRCSPHDLFDHDGVNEIVLADLTIGGRDAKGRDARRPQRLLYVMDRASGEVLSATPFGYVNSNRGVDLKTGRLIPVEEKTPTPGRRGPRHLPGGARHEGLAADVVLAAHRPALHPAPEPVRGHRRR